MTIHQLRKGSLIRHGCSFYEVAKITPPEVVLRHIIPRTQPKDYPLVVEKVEHLKCYEPTNLHEVVSFLLNPLEYRKGEGK